MDLQFEKLTADVIGASFDVMNELGAGFVESVYEKALLVVLREKGIKAESQVPLRVMFRGQSVGEFTADILVESKLVLELKAVRFLLPEHHAQLINYLTATGIDVGLLINFGRSKVEWKRAERPEAYRRTHGDGR